jgi:hypothetical protein
MTQEQYLASLITGHRAEERNLSADQYLPPEPQTLQNSPATPNTGLTYQPLTNVGPSNPAYMKLMEQMIGNYGGGRT